MAKVSRYISISGDNFKTHSAELSSLILHICTEIEILRKRMTGASDNGSAARELFKMYPDVADYDVELPLWSLVFQPWKSLPSSKPDWWLAYEQIKHDHAGAVAAGNLENFLSALSGLYVLTLYYDRFVYSEDAHGGEYVITELTVDSAYFINRNEDPKSRARRGRLWKANQGE